MKKENGKKKVEEEEEGTKKVEGEEEEDGGGEGGEGEEENGLEVWCVWTKKKLGEEPQAQAARTCGRGFRGRGQQGVLPSDLALRRRARWETAGDRGSPTGNRECLAAPPHLSRGSLVRASRSATLCKACEHRGLRTRVSAGYQPPGGGCRDPTSS
ncbi:hypothetical protein P7K49_036523 [Saguinus oedipus]|uniref:Uncharacterized protein n=1 Tax=Saguinus oedipus TaxID=9490 RepID=A0ABQ9TLB9_SAGOE|nr:hypothetical protein P7K49_036523 [Saguinus oedipus]